MNNNYIGVQLALARDPKIQRLEIQEGQSACWIYIRLYLKNAEVEFLDIKDLELYAREFYCDLELLKKIIYNFDLFKVEDDKFFIPEVKERLDDLKVKSNKAKQAIDKRWRNTNVVKEEQKSDTDVIQPYEKSDTDVIQLNKIKENKIKKDKEDKIKKEDPIFKYENAKKEFLEKNSLVNDSEEFDNLIIQFIQHREEIKKSMTIRAVVLLITKVNSWKIPELKQQVEKSIINKWLDIYPFIPEKPKFGEKSKEITDERKQQIARSCARDMFILRIDRSMIEDCGVAWVQEEIKRRKNKNVELSFGAEEIQEFINSTNFKDDYDY